MSRPRLLDLFCGAGGCSVGYNRAGFDVVGVDLKPQKNYPFEFVQADALMFLANLIESDIITNASGSFGYFLSDFDVIHASPPCQRYSAAERIHGNGEEHPDLVVPVRGALNASKKLWVIENVPGSPLHFSTMLCGTQFGLRLRRHRMFESNMMLFSPGNPCNHREGDITVFGHAVQACGSRGTPYKDAVGRTHYRQKRLPLACGCEAMGIDWMTRGEICQAIPPVYTEFLGHQLRAFLDVTT